MESFKNKHKGELGIMVLNGPSLNDVPVDWLNKHITISCNHIYLLSGFNPCYYVVVDPTTLSTPEKANYFMPTIKKAKHSFVWEKHKGNVPSGNISTISRNGKDQWHDDVITQGTGSYASTAWVMVQLGYLMGFDPLLIVGFDCNFEDPRGLHFYNKELEPRIFTSKPPVGNKEWATRLSEHMTLARNAFEKDGRRLINLTPLSGCKKLEFGKVEDWISY